MADTKISALGTLTGAGVASGDLLVIVDVSDGSMAGSGTDKRITAAQFATAVSTLLALGSAAFNNTADFDLAGDAAAAQAASQPLDADLTAIAALSTTAFGRAFLELANAAAARTAIGAVIGTNVQAWDADLDTVAANITAFGQSLIDDANAAAALATLGLDADLATFGLPANTTISAFIKTLLDDTDAATAIATLGAQPSDATLTALAAFNTNGLLTQTAADTFAGRIITAGSAKISVTNGNGVAGNPTVDLGTVAESDITNLSTDLTALQTQASITEARGEARRFAALGYYVAQGLVYSPNGTPTKLDSTVGMGMLGTVDRGIAAQSAIATTIASLADATNPKWVVVEIDASGVTQFNQGTAAAAPALPTFTASRIPAYLLYVPANATNVDTLLTTVNGLAKLIDIRVVSGGASPTGWLYDPNTLTFVSSTTGVGGGLITYQYSGIDATGYIKKGAKVSWDDGTNTPAYGVVASVAFSTNTTVTLIRQSDYVMANAAIKYARYSYEENPQGFPTWFNWSPTLVGWSVEPTNTVYRWTTDGAKVTAIIRQAANGTSNATGHTATAPVTAATIANMNWSNNGRGTDNNVIQTCVVAIASAGTTLSLQGILATATNTNSGNSSIAACQVTYEF